MFYLKLYSLLVLRIFIVSGITADRSPYFLWSSLHVRLNQVFSIAKVLIADFGRPGIMDLIIIRLNNYKL